jgi:hypothetical protein
MNNQSFQFYNESKVEIFSMSKFFHYYKIQMKKNLMLVNKAIIVFIMEIMHKLLVNNFICYLCMMVINQIVVNLDK